ncbi:hypothetical protein PIROE2DRAFT_10356 [Piromyces sp. E2]|nr:hypothetical protein PIROE2DRAFT_10356 [Piromyces sp. E2]|eukprot:OUM63142.1 hypothetical protein PIROE2DRAFT_10356 [Piromyces sp. E2]
MVNKDKLLVTGTVVWKENVFASHPVNISNPDALSDNLSYGFAAASFTSDNCPNY